MQQVKMVPSFLEAAGSITGGGSQSTASLMVAWLRANATDSDKIPGVSCLIVVSWDNNRGRRESHLPDSMCQLGPIPILLVNREYLYLYLQCLYTMIRRVIVVCSRCKRVAS